jgi:2-methylcitrate dehydratase PrpD
VIEKIKLLTLDLIDISLAAQAEPFDVPPREVKHAMDGGGGDVNTGITSPWGGVRNMPSQNAAFLNTSFGHALDFDNAHSKSIIYTAPPIVLPTLAVTEGFHKTATGCLAPAPPHLR